MKDIYSIVKSPLITEKATYQKEVSNQVSLAVRCDANKIEIKRAVESLFNVKVMSVNTANRKGKTKRVGRFVGKKAFVKRAIVKLAPDSKIDFFSGVY